MAFSAAQASRLDLIRTAPAPLPVEDRHKHDLRAVKKGGLLRFKGRTWRVTDLTVYNETDNSFKKQKGYQIFELTCTSLETGETRYVEWEFDDELEIYVTTKKLRFGSLRRIETGGPLKVEILDHLEHDEDGVAVDGRQYWIDRNDCWAAIWTPLGKNPCAARFYEFYLEGDDDGEKPLTIEVWIEGDEKEPEVYLSEKASPRDFEVLALGQE